MALARSSARRVRSRAAASRELRPRCCATSASRQRAAPRRSPRPRGGSGRAWRSPSSRRRRPGRRAASARRRSASRRSRASPSRRGSAGCRCCCRSRPGRPPAAGSPAAPAARSSGPTSASRCSSQVSGSASAGPWPCRRRANSATNALVSGGFGARHVGDDEDQVARRRSRRPRACCRPTSPASVALDARRRSTRAATRRRFSISASRSMIGIAHSSPSFSGCDRLVRGDEARAGSRRRRGRRRARSAPARCRRRAACPARRAVGQPRQLAAVAARQVPPRGADLLFDQVEVVEQPFGRRRDAALGVGGRRRAACRASTRTRSLSARRASSRSGSARVAQHVRAREALAVPRHLLRAEQLGAQRRVFDFEIVRDRHDALPPRGTRADRDRQVARGLGHLLVRGRIAAPGGAEQVTTTCVRRAGRRRASAPPRPQAEPATRRPSGASRHRNALDATSAPTVEAHALHGDDHADRRQEALLARREGDRNALDDDERADRERRDDAATAQSPWKRGDSTTRRCRRRRAWTLGHRAIVGAAARPACSRRERPLY